MVISENCCTFIVLKYKELQTIIAMITEDKVTELFCIADDFCKFFDAMMEKYTLKADKKRQYHRKSTMSKAEIMVIMILFHDSGYRCLKHFYNRKGMQTYASPLPESCLIQPMEQREQKPNLFGLCRVATEEDDSQPIRGT